MARRNLVVIGASAGGLEELRTLMSLLPADFPAAVLVVLHIAASSISVLPAILSRSGPMVAAHPVNGHPLRPGYVYVAPPDHHLLVHRNRVRLSRGPRINGHRPAVDPLFMSAARWNGAKTIGVVLSGVLDDGTNGSAVLKRVGAATIAQSPETAQYSDMPRNAIEHGGIQHVVPVAEMPALLMTLLAEDVPDEAQTLPGAVMPDVEDELAFDPEASAALQGPASSFTCPDCHGALWELKEGAVARYRCRIGHSYGSDGLLAQQSEKIEEALWAGYRALEESAALAKRLSARALTRGSPSLAERYESRYQDALARARTLRDVLERGQLYAAGAEE